jgi:hypothetical protein
MTGKKISAVLKTIQKTSKSKKTANKSQNTDTDTDTNTDSDENNNKNKVTKLSALLDNIIKICPKLKSDKQFIINKLTANNKTEGEYVLDKIVLPAGDYKQDMFNVLTDNKEVYYIDPFDNILDVNGDIVGIFNKTNIGAKYLFFRTESTLPDKIDYLGI